MKSAHISPCGRFRYSLTRGCQENPLVFVMLNPSTADAAEDDPTIRRCVRFAKERGYTGIAVVNLYAFRATKPKDLKTALDPVGRFNDGHIAMGVVGKDVCCAWGANAEASRAGVVLGYIRRLARGVYCLGTTAGGHPRHPLYVRADKQLETY